MSRKIRSLLATVITFDTSTYITTEVTYLQLTEAMLCCVAIHRLRPTRSALRSEMIGARFQARHLFTYGLTDVLVQGHAFAIREEFDLEPD